MQRFLRPALLTLLALRWCCGEDANEVLDAAEELCQAEIDAFASCTERAIAGLYRSHAQFHEELLA